MNRIISNSLSKDFFPFDLPSFLWSLSNFRWLFRNLQQPLSILLRRCNNSRIQYLSLHYVALTLRSCPQTISFVHLFFAFSVSWSSCRDGSFVFFVVVSWLTFPWKQQLRVKQQQQYLSISHTLLLDTNSTWISIHSV